MRWFLLFFIFACPSQVTGEKCLPPSVLKQHMRPLWSCTRIHATVMVLHELKSSVLDVGELPIAVPEYHALENLHTPMHNSLKPRIQLPWHKTKSRATNRKSAASAASNKSKPPLKESSRTLTAILLAMGGDENFERSNFSTTKESTVEQQFMHDMLFCMCVLYYILFVVGFAHRRIVNLLCVIAHTCDH